MQQLCWYPAEDFIWQFVPLLKKNVPKKRNPNTTSKSHNSVKSVQKYWVLNELEYFEIV